VRQFIKDVVLTTGMSIAGKSCRKYSRREVMLMADAEINFCKKEMMSVCTAATDTQQKGCCYYEKSGNTEKCMYFTFNEYCDCLKAQLSAK
jgi:hypothetical protein